MNQPVTVSDLSAVVTGLLLAFNLPANAPWWIAMVGSFLAIILVKQLFGGLGQNFINPALAARAILMLSWTSLMAASVLPHAGHGLRPPLRTPYRLRRRLRTTHPDSRSGSYFPATFPA